MPGVFLSATSGDLRFERQTVKDELLRIDYPVEQDHFPYWRMVDGAGQPLPAETEEQRATHRGYCRVRGGAGKSSLAAECA